MKNERRKGRSARNGNAPAPYTKYKKQPYRYSFSSKEYQGAGDTNKSRGTSDRQHKKSMRAA